MPPSQSNPQDLSGSSSSTSGVGTVPSTPMQTPAPGPVFNHPDYHPPVPESQTLASESSPQITQSAAPDTSAPDTSSILQPGEFQIPGPTPAPVQTPVTAQVSITPSSAEGQPFIQKPGLDPYIQSASIAAQPVSNQGSTPTVTATATQSPASQYTPPPTNPPVAPIQAAQATPPSSEAVINELPPFQVPPHAPPNSVPREKSSHVGLFIFVIVLFVLAAGGAYAYTQKLGPFATAPYDETNLLTGLLNKITQIESSSYAVSAQLYATDREVDAYPYIPTQNPDAERIALQYERDSQRIDDISSIISALRYSTMDAGYPATIDGIQNPYAYTDELISTKDPLTQKTYTYRLTEEGQNFNLSITFETQDAIDTIKEYAYDPSSIVVEGKTTIFNNNSPIYFYFEGQQPTFFESMSAFAQFLPPEINIQGSVDVALSRGDDINPWKWKFMLDGSGDVGDLTYKINIEALKDDLAYYFKINNFPALGLTGLMPPKGQWIRLSSEDIESEAMNFGFVDQSEMVEMEEDFKVQQEQALEFTKKIIQYADEEKLLSFKQKPQKSTENGRVLYRYDLAIRQEAVLPFYQKLADEAVLNPELFEDTLFTDPEYVTYLESEEFSQMFEYFDQNVDFVLWVDAEGFPAKYQVTTRIVPGDEVISFRDKQLIFEVAFEIRDINVPIQIETPTDSKTYEEILELSASTSDPTSTPVPSRMPTSTTPSLSESI